MLPNQISPTMNETHSACFLMKMITDRASCLFMQEMGDLGITPAQSRVLMYLERRRGESVSQRDLERHLCVSHTTVKGLLQRLEEKGWVRTAFDDSKDGRVKHAYLTNALEMRHNAARENIRRLEERVLSPLSADERVQLNALLSRVLDNLLEQ